MTTCGALRADRRGATGLALVAALGLAGCGPSGGTATALGPSQPGSSVASPASSYPASPSSEPAVSAAGLRALAAQYLQIARPANRQLAAIHFPPAIAAVAAALIKANHARVRLTLTEARSRTATELRTFRKRRAAADTAVEVQVRACARPWACHHPQQADRQPYPGPARCGRERRCGA